MSGASRILFLLGREALAERFRADLRRVVDRAAAAAGVTLAGPDDLGRLADLLQVLMAQRDLALAAARDAGEEGALP